MKISAKARYAVRLLLDLAMHQNQGPVRTASLAEHTGISVRFIEQILQPLKRDGLVKSTRGAAGGYLLSADPRDISVARIVRVIEGTISLALCCDDPSTCKRSPVCSSHKAWVRATQVLEAELEAITIAQMQEGLPAEPVAQARPKA